MPITVNYPTHTREYRPAKIQGGLMQQSRAYIQIDMRDGKVCVGYGYPNSQPGHDVVRGHVLRFGFDKHMEVEQVRDMIDDLLPLLDELMSSYKVFYDCDLNLCGRHDLDIDDRIIWAISRFRRML